MDEMKVITKPELVIFTFLTMMISGASSIAGNDNVRILALGLLLLYGYLKHKPLVNNTVLCILAGWTIINVCSSLYLNEKILFYTFIGKVILIYLAFLILSCCNGDFWEKYERVLYKLVIISFVIYIFSLFFPAIFNSLTPVFRSFTEDTFYQKESQQHYFYSFFFVWHGADTDAAFRNNGFMWEPGAYAMVLNILIAYNFARNGIRINKRIKIYFLALLTTFSTAGYLSFLFILLWFLLDGKNIYTKILIILCGIFSIGWIMSADFLLPKIQEFVESAESGDLYNQGYRDFYEANRILSFNFLLDKFLMFPLGWGCIQDTSSYMALNHIVTVNGLGSILVSWGFLGFSFFLYSISRFFYQYRHSFSAAIFPLLAIATSFFSNPIEYNILLYILVLSPYMGRKNTK